MALVMAPFLLEDPRVHDMFPGDAIARAREYLVHVKGGFGAYSDSKGNPFVRQEVCCSCCFLTYISICKNMVSSQFLMRVWFTSRIDYTRLLVCT